jgi:hypothetical protein
MEDTMKLLTKEIRNSMPKINSTDGDMDATVQVKFFTPMSNWTWWAFEGEPILNEGGVEVDYYFYGLVSGFETEWGTWSLNEMESVGGAIERDRYYQPETKRDLLERVWPDFLSFINRERA